MVGEAEGSWQLRQEINRLDQLIRGLYDRLNIPLPEVARYENRPALTPAPPDVLEALQRGKTIEAIKHWREHTGDGLADSKAKVDQLKAQLGL